METKNAELKDARLECGTEMPRPNARPTVGPKTGPNVGSVMLLWNGATVIEPKCRTKNRAKITL